ncbi:MAG: hypothetical protein V5A44_13375 [Haloarculaceae archaeon]
MSTRSVPDAAPMLARGGLVGVAAWLLGYLVTYLLHGGNVRDALATDILEFLAGDPVTWKLVGWLYFNAHFVDASVPGLLGSSTVNLLSGAEDAALLVLYVVPPVALLGAGVFLAGGTDEPATAAREGAAVALGYLLVSLVAAFAVRITVADAVAGPVLVTAVLLAGLVYPFVFGALGGAAVAAVAGSE